MFFLPLISKSRKLFPWGNEIHIPNPCKRVSFVHFIFHYYIWYALNSRCILGVYWEREVRWNGHASFDSWSGRNDFIVQFYPRFLQQNVSVVLICNLFMLCMIFRGKRIANFEIWPANYSLNCAVQMVVQRLNGTCVGHKLIVRF